MSDPKPKSPSQRLRAVIYLHWQKDNKGEPDFEKYYANLMDRIIEFYKQKL